MPSMMSMPLESKRMRFDGKSTPFMLILTTGHISLVFISPPGELTSMACFMFPIGRSCFGTKLDVMNECGARIPKSFIFSRDKIPSMLHHVQQNLNNIMAPYTALNLKVCPLAPPPPFCCGDRNTAVTYRLFDEIRFDDLFLVCQMYLKVWSRNPY
jgi:hypothetical protein